MKVFLKLYTQSYLSSSWNPSFIKVMHSKVILLFEHKNSKQDIYMNDSDSVVCKDMLLHNSHIEQTIALTIPTFSQPVLLTLLCLSLLDVGYHGYKAVLVTKQYWPAESGSGQSYGPFNVTVLEQHIFADYTIRTIQLVVNILLMSCLEFLCLKKRFTLNLST